MVLAGQAAPADPPYPKPSEVPMTRMTPIARGLALTALTLAAQVAFAQTMCWVAPMPLGGEPWAMDSHGKFLVFNPNGSCYLCGKASCNVLATTSGRPSRSTTPGR